jgi:NADH:ubiquinone reductase (H+-translocating)
MSALNKFAYAGGGFALGYLAWKAFAGGSEIWRNRGRGNGKTFIIVGAGFAGLAAAGELARLLPDPNNGDVLLIDEDNFLLFTPMPAEAAGGEVDSRHIVHPVDHVSARIQFIEGTVTGIDLTKKTVEVKRGRKGSNLAPKQYQADHIVIALGSVTNFHDIPGLAEIAIPMKKLEDAVAVCDRALACLEQASTEEDPNNRQELLTFVVAGGGFSGVETMAALNGLLRANLRKYPKITSQDIRTILINPGDRQLTETTPDLAAYAHSELKERGVETRMNTKISGAIQTYGDLEGGERIPARTLIWTAGVKPNPLVEQLECEKGKHGGIKVNACCQMVGRDGIWALGDCADVPHSDGKGSYAPTAQNATPAGKLVARNIVAALRGMKAAPFQYRPVGELALVGRRAGVARIYGHNFSGPLAWAMWRATYLAKMPGAGQKARILSDWVLDLIFGRDPISVGPGRPALLRKNAIQ